MLERSITDTRLSFRRLGSNTSITRPQNDVLFCLTMNLTNLGTDLRRRALPVNLVLEEDVRRTSYGLTDVVGFVEERRLEIVSELAGMVAAWLGAEKPQFDDPAQHSTSQLWAATMDAILRLSGFEADRWRPAVSSMGTKVRSSSERAARARAARSSVVGRRVLRVRVAFWPAEWREAFEERSAIVEFCGGLRRADAEVLAAELVQVEFVRCTARGPPARP